MGGNPRDGGLPGSKRAEIVNRPIGPDDLHAPDAAHLHGQQDRGQTLGWFILWQHRQNKQIRPMKLRTARLVSRRAVLDAILLFGDKNLFPQVTDEFDRNRRRRVQLRRRKLSGPLAVVFRTSQGRFVMKGRIASPRRRLWRQPVRYSSQLRTPPIHPPTRSPVLCRIPVKSIPAIPRNRGAMRRRCSRASSRRRRTRAPH